ncbi:hypothetical protein L1049_027829 [Liquidambar formosana]|uniref:Uncharacterized protein n=1 Tax=Liquidambar formosana TaxID=63359 RepID=A0AAP0RI00_LIQFO
MATPKEHIEEIRKKKFSIGGELNPLTEDLHQPRPPSTSLLNFCAKDSLMGQTMRVFNQCRGT